MKRFFDVVILAIALLPAAVAGVMGLGWMVCEVWHRKDIR